MDRTRTRLIIAVTNRLSAAADTDARTDLIEELSENLYQRYLDLTASGVEESAAYTRALDELGDVDELLEYLRTQDPDSEPPRQSGEHTAASFDFDNMVRGAEGIVRETISQTKDAMYQAKDIVRDVAHKLKERYPHGARDFTGAPTAEDTVIPAEGLTGLDIHLVNGDVDIRVVPDSAQVVLSGSTQQLHVRLREDGVLSIRPDERTASAAFFSTRGLLSTDVVLLLPARHWDSVSIHTASGDIELHDPIDTAALTVSTTSGDVDLCGISGPVQLSTASGDVELKGDYTELTARTASGDIDLRGAAQSIRCATASGDVELHLNALPHTLDASSKSGDIDLRIPDGLGFRLGFRTVSGDLWTDFDLVGSLSSRCREAVYLDGGSCEMTLETISGDATLRRL